MNGTNNISSFDTAPDDSPFFDNDMPTMRSSSSSSDGLPHVTGLNWEGSVESNEVSTEVQTFSVNPQKRHRCCSDTPSFSARTLTNAKRAALAEWVKVITQNSKGAMEAMMQLPPVVRSIVVWGHMLVFHPPTRAQRHMNIYSSLVCVQFLMVNRGLTSCNAAVSAGPGRVLGTNWLL